jgi:hypothetical protein
MTIDDPIESAVKQVRGDERRESPVVHGFVAGLELLPHFGPVAKAFKRLFTYREENISYLLSVLLRQLQLQSAKFDKLSTEHADFLKGNFQPLVVNAIAKTENLHCKSRIDRIAQILTYAVVEGPRRDPDLTEEMMRIAGALSDDDVQVLREIHCVQEKHLSAQGNVPNELVNDSWRDKPPKIENLNAGEIQSICAKLESFGLVTRVDRNPSKLFHTTIPYGLLQRGHDFILYVYEEAASIE